jgi:DNA/RNA-binding domain of Phe-tRNA-synthetase-like protein
MGMKIQSTLLEKYSGLGVLEVSFDGIIIRKSLERLQEFKRNKQDEISKRIPLLEAVKDIPVIRAYRDFYWKVGIDPTKTRPAGEALIRKILGGRDLPTINTFVDSYNIASAESSVAIAAFDADIVDSNSLLMRTATIGEVFLGIGMELPVSLSGIEVVIEDKKTEKLVAVYPYRDSDESKVTEKTRHVFLLMCGVPQIPQSELILASKLTRDYVSQFCI